MNASIVQVLAASSIVIIGLFVFIKYPFKPTTKDLTLASLFVVLSLIMSSISMQIPLFGAMSLKIGLSQLPLILGGAILGPTMAFVCGLIQDVLDIILNPSGFPFFGFTLNKVLIGLIPALWFTTHKKTNAKTFALIIGLLWTLCAITSGGLFVIKSEQYNFDTITKLLIIAVEIVVVVILTIATLIIKKKYTNASGKYAMVNWMMSVTLVEIFIQLCLTPTWLDVMYGIPFYLNLLVRLVKAPVSILVNTVIGYFVLKAIEKVRH